MATIRGRLATGDYDEGYVHFVLNAVGDQVKTGKVKKEAGAVFKALTDGYLLPSYRKAQRIPASAKVKANPALIAKRRKLVSSL